MAGEREHGRRVVPAWAVDGAIALAVALLGLSSGLGVGRAAHVPPGAIALLTAMGVILVLRRRFPGVVLIVMAGLVIWLDALHTSLEGAFIAVLVAGYGAAVYGSRLLARVLLVAAVATPLGVGIAEALGADKQVPAVAKTGLAAAGAWLVGLVVRRQLQARQQHIAALAERAELIAAQQAEQARRATLAERLRIARELHDIVAHHLSVVVIQAQAAQRVADPDRAKQAMADVEQTGRTALDEMRRLLGLLRTGEPGEPADAPAAPPLGLADLEVLAQRAHLAGLPVTLVQHGERSQVPADVGLTVYRIVQESLTNVLKHAGPATATVELTFGEACLDVTVTDDGRGASAALADVPGAGRGTAGMRERIAMLDGSIATGPRPGGGYQVHATIPMGHP